MALHGRLVRVESCSGIIRAAVTAARWWGGEKSDVVWLPDSTKLDRAIRSNDYAPVVSAQSIPSPPLHLAISGSEPLFSG